MKLTANNIRFVKRLELNGVTYAWYVGMKSGQISDSRYFINYDKRGRTCAEPYPMERLPKSVQTFIGSHEERVFSESNEDNFMEYIIEHIYRKRDVK